MSNPGDDDAEGRDKESARADRTGNGRDPGAANAVGEDHGTEIIGDVVGIFLRDLASIEGGAVEGFRLDTQRAGELLGAHGLDVSRPYRVELRRKRRLIDKLYEVVEADLPAEEPQD